MVSGVAATVVNVVVLAIAYPMYLHFLGYEKYGVWLVLATVLSFAQLGNLGVGQAASMPQAVLTSWAKRLRTLFQIESLSAVIVGFDLEGL